MHRLFYIPFALGLHSVERKKYFKGFSIFELAIAILIMVILMSILAVKFFDLAPQARQQATNSVADALNVASALNYTYYRSGSPKMVIVANCQNVTAALPPSQPMPVGYTINSLAILPGTTQTCTVVNPDGTTTATFIGRGTA